MSLVPRLRTPTLVVRHTSNARGTMATETKISTILAVIYITVHRLSRWQYLINIYWAPTMCQALYSVLPILPLVSGVGCLPGTWWKGWFGTFFLLPPYMDFCHIIQLLPLWALYRPGIVLLAPATKDVAQTAHRLFSILLHGPSSWLNIVNLCAPGRDGHF